MGKITEKRRALLQQQADLKAMLEELETVEEKCSKALSRLK
jgi:uncharacterized coiled-coil protein SlyX